MVTKNPQKEIDVLQKIIKELSVLDDEAKKRIMNTISTFFQMNIGIVSGTSQVIKKINISGESSKNRRDFSQHIIISPKEFMLEKSPRTNAEKMACLGFYLTHYRDMPHFKTLDLSKLNTEAAQQKFTNTAQATKDATRAGLLVPATKGYKQLGAIGEQYVQALPDKEEAKKILQKMRRSRKRKVTKKTSRKK